MTLKALYNLALRQATGMVQGLLKLAGLNWAVPDYSTLCRCQRKLRVVIAYRAGQTVRNLLVDSTGLKMLGQGRWKRKEA